MTMTPEEIRASKARHPSGATARHLSLVPDLPADVTDSDVIPAPKGSPVPVPCPGEGRPPCLLFEPGRGLCMVCAEPVALSPAGLALAHQRDDLMTRLLRGDYD